MLSSFGCLDALGSLIGWLTFFPIRSGVGVMMVPRRYDASAPILALWCSSWVFFLAMVLWATLDSGRSGYQSSLVLEWRSGVNISFSLGVDGISLFFVRLSVLLTPVCMLASMAGIQVHRKFYYGLFLRLEGFVNMVFLATDLLTFYIFFESVLIPMFLVIGVWGSRIRKVRAAYFFFLYTLLGSLFMLLGMLSLYASAGTLDMVSLAYRSPELPSLHWIWLAFFVSLAVKVPMLPVHIWLPEAHVEAPTAGSVLLAGILLKLGTYGMRRLLVGIFGMVTSFFQPYVYALVVMAIIYTSRTAIRQTDMKRIIAYASVAHMNLTLAGLFSLTPQGVDGSIVQMISHGLVSGALFMCVGVLYDQNHSRMVSYYGGVAQTMPRFTGRFLFFTMANLALPGTSSFVGEFLILLGVFQTNSFVALSSASTMVLGGAYSLWLFNRIVYGSWKNRYLGVTLDLNHREMAAFFPLALMTLWIGVLPGFLLDSIRSSTMELMEFTRWVDGSGDSVGAVAERAVRMGAVRGSRLASSLEPVLRGLGSSRLVVRLPKVYGVGPSLARELCDSVGISPRALVSDVLRHPRCLASMEGALRDRGFRVSGDLRRWEVSRISLYSSLGARRGIRMRLGLPVHGQRTSSNAGTAKRLNASRLRLTSPR